MLSSTQKIILAFVTLILGLVLITQIATSTNSVSSTTVSTQNVDISSARLAAGTINTTLTFTPTVVATARTGWRPDYSECNAVTTADGIYRNATGSVFTKDTDYAITATGAFTLKNTALVNGSTNTTVVVLNSCPDTYLTQNWTRTVTTMIPGFFALALLIVAVGLFYSVAKDEGILG